jgi:hypothetical protein
MLDDGTKKNFKTMLAEAKLPERTVQVCLRGDLVAEHEQLNEQLELLEKKAVDSLAGNGGAELAAGIDALEAEMRDNSYPFRLRALSKSAYRSFKADFPPRIGEDGEVNKRDQAFDFDAEAGFEPLLRMSLVDPDLDDEEWAHLLETLTERQFDDLAGTAWILNRGEIDVPFSRAASRLNRLIAGD